MTTIALPGYRIIQQLYSGFKSQVYRVFSELDGQLVVLKLLKEEYPTFNQLVQFRNQYTIAKNLDLPGIVKPIRLENYRNSFLLVMEDDGCVSLSEYAGVLDNRENAPIPNAWNLSEFLHVALQIAQTLEGIHQHRIIHKDIKPQNILINPETKQVKLIDFSISSLLPRESQEISNPNILEGTLAYISPEQTGRMNRGIDYRTDFYSLGVTFYELLTGQLPFPSSEPMESIHYHIARMPTPPVEINPAIGQVLNNIVMKLMAKTAENRYQTAFGLRVDLEKCLEQLAVTGSITFFELASRDISERFIIPEKLYGREAEVATLLAAFDRVAGLDEEIEETTQSKISFPGRAWERAKGSASERAKAKIEMMLVAGFSGVGKTAVVNEVHKPIVRQRGYFIKGKFDQFKREMPFSAWVEAFQNLMRQLLAENNVSVQAWKAKIEEALGENGQVIIDVIPELERIIGKQQPGQKFTGGDGIAAQNRFNLLFGKFLHLFATKEHPLVIFLDDLQWADGASLKLMELLMSESDTHYLLLIGAYRDNEVCSAHPLMLTLNEIRKRSATVNQITLAPLDQPSLNRLIADTLSCSPQRAVPLTELVLQKTKGNPFFSSQFLKSLHDEGLIFFNPPQSPRSSGGSEGGWQCDIAKVKALSVSDDVVEFMAAQLQKLPANTQSVLKLAACIGNSFDLDTLSIVYEKSLADTAADLWKALQEGLVIPRSEVYKFFQESESVEVVQASDLSVLGLTQRNPVSPKNPRLGDQGYIKKQRNPVSPKNPRLGDQGYIQKQRNPVSPKNPRLGDQGYIKKPGFLTVSYKFIHDRVQQAAYFLIPATHKQSTHLQIGRLLLNKSGHGGIPLTAEEREEKIFDIVNQLNIGTRLISDRAELDELARLNTIAGRKAKASTAYTAALGYFTRGMELLAAQSWSLYDLSLALHEEAAEAAYIIGDRQQAERLAEVVLQQARTLLDKMKVYGVKIKAYQTQNKPLEAIATGLSVLALLGLQFPAKPSQLDIQHGLEEIKSKLASKKIEYLIHLPQMTDSEKLAAMRIFSLLTPSLYSTNIELLSLFVFKQVNLSIIYGNALESVAAYANYGLILCGIVGDIEYGYKFGQLALSLLERLEAKEVKAKTVFYAYVWIKHWKEHLRDGLKPFLDAYSSGLETGDVQFAALSAYLYCTTSFVLGKNLAELRQEMANYGDVLARLKQATTLDKHKIYQQAVIILSGLSKNNRDNNELLKLVEVNQKTVSFQVYITQLMLCYLFSDYVKALENAVNTEKYLNGGISTLNVPIFHFYDSLVRLAVYKDTPHSEQQGILDKVRANQEKMQKWAHHAPMNHLHKFYLVEAERHRVLGEYVEAMELYDRAIAGAKENDYINEEALANEVAAKFYLSWGKQTIAQTYLTNAYYAYARWGALAKVEDLEQRYPQLLALIKAAQSEASGTTRGKVISSTTGNSEVLDLATVIAASQALSQEVNLERLLSTLMQVVIENAGASFGALILHDGTNLTLEAITVLGSQAQDTDESQLCRNRVSPRNPVSLATNCGRPLTLYWDFPN